MRWLPWLLAGGAALVVVDRLLLAAEARGWVYWRRRTATGSSAGSALLGVQAILEPNAEHVVAEERRQADDIDVAGDDDPLDDP